MNRRVVLKQDRGGGGGGLVPCRQPYLYPEDLIGKADTGPGLFWTCVRTRPRWEKKFAEWLMAHRHGFFLPVFRHETSSGRKRRSSELPLFPGFVFVEGDLSKKDFAATGCVAYVLRPRGSREARQLEREIRNIWRGVVSGLYVTPVHNLAAGEPCRIVAGPLQGAEAKYERPGRMGRLILQVEMMGSGIAVEVPSSEVEAGS